MFLVLSTSLAILDFIHWLQPEASAAGGSAAASGGGGGAGVAGCAGGNTTQLGFLAIMFLVFWFLIISPQRKQQKAHDEMLKALHKGQSVRTTGGVLGEIIDIDERQVTLKIAAKTKINVLRSHISGVEGVGGDKGPEDKT